MTRVPISQKNMTALRKCSVSSVTLPPGQYDKGMVRIDQLTSATQMPISGENVETGLRCTAESNIYATKETVAARSAMRRLLSTGNHSCGASSRMAVNATRALNARSVSGTDADAGIAGASGRHQSWERSDVSIRIRSEEHTSELQSQSNLVCRLLLEKKKKKKTRIQYYGKII